MRTRTAIGDDGVAATSMLYAQEELDEGQRFSGSMAVDDLIDLADWAPVDTPVEVSVGADISTGA
ncbi:MAG: hypothetical protein ACRD1K_13230, partial [Acidimicrobiales bacterium]